MALTTVVLGQLKRGIDRTAYRGTVPSHALYDLRNAYVTIAGHFRKRPPFTYFAKLDPATKGLFSNGGNLHTFYTGTLAVPIIQNDANNTVQAHPIQPPAPLTGGAAPTLLGVYFDALFMGLQYTIAQFNDGFAGAPGPYRHYWMTQATTWAPNTNYNTDAVVQPTTPNGFYYKPANTQFPPAWQANAVHKVGDVIVPTTINGWKFTCIQASGANPASGATEPAWPTSNGATIAEESTGAAVVQPTPPAPPAPPTPPGYGGSVGGTGVGSPWNHIGPLPVTK